ncbi:lysine biosynthesis enzyme LysX [halophilic archaeon DL31]|jgi:[lysine-biosynthesis-protein LysW]--L-2-aminoadipate ligase|nr:lysine biosynthesis enzyme LysX [halophilic archaeon DL31]
MEVRLLYSRIRADEKLLLAELRERGHKVVKADTRTLTFDLDEPPALLADCDVVLDRCLATSRSRYATRFLDHYGIPVVNGADTAAVCADKVETSLALQAAGIPTPETTVAFTTDAALEAIEAFGYPCVLKPVVGSWGRLMAKLESRSAAEAVLEHKETLGSYEHSVFYIQQFVEKPGRDVRVLMAGGDTVAAMTRSSDHWITNAAAGAETEPFELDEQAESLAKQASEAVGGGLLGVDLMETGDGYTVHEVNHTVEFSALNGAVETDIAGEIVDWLETVPAVDSEVTT